MILSLCKQLVNLNFCQLYYYRSLPIRIYHLPSTSCVSSTLVKLKVSVSAFGDCLYLLDGRLNCLSTLIIHVERISFSVVDIDNTVNITLGIALREKALDEIIRHSLIVFSF